MFSQKILDRYADVMVKFAANNGNGIPKNSNVRINCPVIALQLGRAIYKKVLEVGAYPFFNIIDEKISVIEYTYANENQLTYYPEKWFKSIAETIDHSINIIGSEDVFYLKGIDAKKIMMSNRSIKPYRDLLNKKQDEGNYSWTLCSAATESLANEAGLTLKQYENQIIKACFLDKEDPVKEWKKVSKEQNIIMSTLNNMPISKIFIKSLTTDLTITLGDKRKWIGGGGCNIPSFEIFTSPDWTGTNGFATFEQPLYRYGNKIEGIRLEFKNGKVIKASATKNENLLKEMIKEKNADKIGEFSLTDKKFSRISKFMAGTLYDENFGGKYGNFHIAVGNSYHDTYNGDPKTVTKEEYKKLGFNDSVIHTDIISTSNRVVTVELNNGEKVIIYKNGSFVI